MEDLLRTMFDMDQLREKVRQRLKEDPNFKGFILDAMHGGMAAHMPFLEEIFGDIEVDGRRVLTVKPLRTEPMYEAMADFAGNIPDALPHGKPLTTSMAAAD